MFDILIFSGYASGHGSARYAAPFPGCAGGAQAARGPSRGGRPLAGRGGAGVRRLAPVGERLGGPTPPRRGGCAPLGQAGTAALPAPLAARGSEGGAPDRRPLPRPAEAALCALDARGGGEAPGRALRLRGVGVDGGPLAQTLGLHAAEAAPPGLRAGRAGGGALAEGGIPGHTPAGEAGEGRDSLGRRDGPPERPS